MPDLAVFMRQHMTLRDDTPPGDLGMFVTNCRRDPARGFTDDLDVTLDSSPEHSILKVLMETPAFDELENCLSGIQHVPQVRKVRLVSPHR
jgi:hypothetical protein